MSAATTTQEHGQPSADLSAVSSVVEVLSQLSPIAEPQMMFTQALRVLAPQLCDFCSVELIDDDGQSSFVCWPAPEPIALASEAGRPRADVHTIVDRMVHTPVRVPADESGPALRGVLSLRFDSAEPGAAEALLGQLVVERVLALINTDRLQRQAVTERARAEHLEQALVSSREIGTAMGIMMAQQKCRSDEAFAQLRQVSQNTHRKVRDLALDVIDTGVLDLEA